MRPSKKVPRGFILYEGKSEIGDGDIVVIATLHTRNGKTGKMITVWVLPQHIKPSEASKTLGNEFVCGNCMLQGVIDPKTGKLKWRVCYVIVGQACNAIWKCYKHGGYPKYNPKKHDKKLLNRKIRWTGFGDPAAVPFRIIKKVTAKCIGHTGYTHQAFWIQRDKANQLAEMLMVSCHTPAQFNEAERRGWRAFVTLRKGQKPPANSVECPHYTHGVQCIDCGLCCGTSLNAKHVFARVHGTGSNNLVHIQNLQGAAL